MEYSVDTFEDRLRSELVERKSKNPSYSLRAFARDLGIQASPLSAILRNRRPITGKMKKRIGLALGLTPEEINAYSTQRELSQQGSNPTFSAIDIDSFHFLSDWTIYAVLEAFELHDFVPSILWISKRIGLEPFQVEQALEKLERQNFIYADDSFYKMNPHFRFTTSLSPGTSSIAKRRFQKQVLDQSIKAVDQVPIESRDHSGVILAIDTEDLPKVRELTQEYQHRITQLVNQSAKKNQVYQLQVSFFPTDLKNQALGSKD